MRVVIAPDKFKGSLSASVAAEAMARGVVRAAPWASVDRVPMADGGEGTVAALVAATGGSFREATVSGPMGEPVVASFGLLGDGRTAAIEMAAASGLVLVRRGSARSDDRDHPGHRRAAAGGDRGGGEAGDRRHRRQRDQRRRRRAGPGPGLRSARRVGRELDPGGGSLGRLARIDATGRRPELDGIEVAVACDVTNPLCGPRGASAVYGPQKGATPEMVEVLDANLAHYRRDRRARPGRFGPRDPGLRRAPAAWAAAWSRSPSGRLEPGINLVIEAVALRARLEGADLCLTGEGALDDQSAFGKTAVGVGRLARSLGCPVLALAGSIGPGAEATFEEGLDAYFSICPGPVELEQAMSRAAELLEEATTQAVRAFLAGRRRKSASDGPPAEGFQPGLPRGVIP